jgi:hypothetical protein
MLGRYYATAVRLIRPLAEQANAQYKLGVFYDNGLGVPQDKVRAYIRFMEETTIDEWNLLKHQFDALVHDESVVAESIDEILDVQFRRRFTELINQTANAMPRQVVITGPDAKTPMECGMRRHQIVMAVTPPVSLSPTSGRGPFSLLWPPLPCFQKRLASFPAGPAERRGKSPTSMP